MARANGSTGPGPRTVLIAVLAGLIIGIGSFVAVTQALQPRRSTPAYDPPVLAGQHIWGACSGGFYARLGKTIVLTSAGHCASEGTVAKDPDGNGVRGVFGPSALVAICPDPGHRCAAPDVNYLVVANDRVPWGHLNVVDMGTAGYRTIPRDTAPFACGDIAVGDLVEIDGRNTYRSGIVAEKSRYLDAGNGSSYPCMIASRIRVDVGDSGGAVLVRGLPGGVTLRSFGGYLGFTPLAESLTELGLELCTTPDCGLAPPVAVPAGTAK